MRLAKANASLMRRFDGRLGTLHGISFADFTILLNLSYAPGAKLRRIDLAEKVGLTASAVTRALIPLERIGLVTRQRDMRDARIGYALLTKSGQRVLQEALSSAELVSEGAVPAKSEPELRALTELLISMNS
jgi:DNA-binding MarR family transcriptional regulator